MTRRGWIAAGVVVLGLMVPAIVLAKIPLHGTIKEGVGMAGAKLGMTLKQVRTKWGKPQDCFTSPSSKLRVCHWTQGSGNATYISASASFQKGKAVYFYVFAGKWKTKRGAKYHTKYARLRKLYPKMKFAQTCVLDRGYVGEVGKKSGVTSFRFLDKTGAQQGISGVDSIVIYDARKIDWDAAGPGAAKRPPNHAQCVRRGVG